MSTLKYTPEQASAVATVASAGSLNPREYYAGYMRFLGVSEGDHTSLTESVILDRIRSTDTDPITARRDRAKAFDHIWLALHAFAKLRPFTQAAPAQAILPYDLLGVVPRDPAGQAVLMFALIKRAPLHEIALAFSIPFADLGRRLLEGELIGERDIELRGAAIRACDI